MVMQSCGKLRDRVGGYLPLLLGRWFSADVPVQARHNITLRWDTALNQRRIARFVFPRDDSALRLVLGAPVPGRPMSGTRGIG